MGVKRFLGREKELANLCAIISLNYSDEILGKVGSVLQAAHIVSETALSFYEMYEKDLKQHNLETQEYEARIEHFSLLYIKKHFDIQLTSFVTA
jgi:hypothetical protein